MIGWPSIGNRRRFHIPFKVNKKNDDERAFYLGLKARIIKGSCITLNQTTVDLWHADFDGDEMVFEIFDDDYAIAEIRHLMRLPRQIVNEQTGSNPVHVVQGA